MIDFTKIDYLKMETESKEEFMSFLFNIRFLRS